MLPTILMTMTAMVAFAANSLLTRMALSGGSIDASSFVVIRLASGALALLLLLAARRDRGVRDLQGNWSSSLALLGYAAAFSFAYLRLNTATGALILFASVQATMIGWALLRGDRPNRSEQVGLLVAFAAFVALLLPGIDTPDLIGCLLMITSGISWAVYSLRGRGARDPLGETAGNFVRSAAMCLPLMILPIVHATTSAGIGLAIASGAVTSGVGYAIWYHVLRRLSITQAALVQLTVPALAAVGAAGVLLEAPSMRVLVTGACILGGVSFAIVSRRVVAPPT